MMWVEFLQTLQSTLSSWLWVALLGVGGSLLFTAYYFRRQSKKLSHSITQLYNINEAVQQDALDFFDQAWPVLQGAGCVGLKANIEWFGEQKTVSKGSMSSKQKTQQSYVLSQNDMRFALLIGYSREAAASESIALIVVRTFIHVLEQDLVIKQTQILTSQKRLERYQLFVQHEIKNIAQFVQLLSEQVQALSTQTNAQATKIKLFNRLEQTVPVMAERARKTIQHMQHPMAEQPPSTRISLAGLLQEVVIMYDLKATITGQSQVVLPREILLEVFKNILGNFRDHASSSQPLKITINRQSQSHAHTIQITITHVLLSNQNLLPERLFEPFWTTSDSGMGLGLFLARELLKQMQGQITFKQAPNQPQFSFVITLPGSQLS